MTYQPPQPSWQPNRPAPRNPAGSAWSRMSPGKRVALILVSATLVLCGGGLTGITALGAAMGPAPTAPAPRAGTPASTTEASTPAVAATTASAVPATPAGSAAPPSPSATSRAPVVEKRTVRETRKIPFKTRTVKDDSRARGTRTVETRGVAGVRTLTYEVTVTDGVETGRKLVRSVVTERPVTRMIAVGTGSEPECDPNYSGGCVPIASDVDCGGGSGNGPAYVHGVVRVVGTDIYELDRDDDGYGCD